MFPFAQIFASLLFAPLFGLVAYGLTGATWAGLTIGWLSCSVSFVLLGLTGGPGSAPEPVQARGSRPGRPPVARLNG